MEFCIKKAEMKNLLDIQELNQKLCSKESREFDSTILGDFSFSNSGETYFIRMIKEECVLIAEISGEIVGYLAGGIVDKEAFRNVEKMSEVENMFVLEEFRGKGIGKKLLDGFIEWCKLKKVTRVRVSASVKNTGGINFYRREGFEEYILTLEREM